MLIRHAGRRCVQGGAVSIGRAGRGRTECRHWSEGGRCSGGHRASPLSKPCALTDMRNSESTVERSSRSSKLSAGPPRLEAVNTAKGNLCRHRDRNPTGGA